MEVGSPVWVLDATKGWIAAYIQSKTLLESEGIYRLFIHREDRPDGDLAQYDLPISSIHELDNVKLRNRPDESMVEDLINLPHLHEPSILYTLEEVSISFSFSFHLLYLILSPFTYIFALDKC